MNNQFTSCTICNSRGTLESAKEVAKIRCNVRAFRNEIFSVWRCNNCRSIHALDSVDLDRYYENYPMRNQRVDFGTRISFGNRKRLLDKFGVSKNSKIIDYGSGTSLFVKYLNSIGYDAIGYDPYVPQYANQDHLRSKYDFVISQDVLEHEDDPVQGLKKQCDLLAENGILCIGTPNAAEVELTSDFLLELHQPYHRHIYSESALIEQCKSLGLEHIYTTNRFYFDSPIPSVNLSFIRHYLERLGGDLDAGFEPPDVKSVLLSPTLIFHALFGYYMRSPGNMTCVFRQSS